jgi:glycosyltransferase involved in cell wall biosynthesis
MSIVFVEQNEEKLFIQNEFQIPDNKIDSSIVIWNINKCFKIFPEQDLDLIKNKWNIKKRYIIFSPRTLSEFYNHHILLEGINQLDEKWKRDIQVIAVGIDEESYIHNLLDLASKYKIELTIINKYLSPMEMAELYNLSHLNVNIPKHDLFGMCIQEGCLCGSIPLLNIDIPTYHEYMKDKINCFYVKLDSTDIAEKIENILNRCHHLKATISKNNVNLFIHRQNSEENSEILVQRLNVLIGEKGRLQ